MSVEEPKYGQTYRLRIPPACPQEMLGHGIRPYLNGEDALYLGETVHYQRFKNPELDHGHIFRVFMLSGEAKGTNQYVRPDELEEITDDR